MFRLILFFFVGIFILSCERNSKKNIVAVRSVIRDTIIKEAPGSKIRFYLTFDDGPYKTTPKLVSTLKKLNVKSSFFIVGSQVRYSPEYDSIFNMVKNTSIFKIYNHTYTHAVTNGSIHIYYQNPEKVFEDISMNKDIIKTGGNITRLPGKNAWRIGYKKLKSDPETQALINYMDSLNIKENLVGWNLSWKLKHSQVRANVDTLINQVKFILDKDKSTIKHFVFLSHDYLYKDEKSLENLAYFINRLKVDLNCSFHWVEEMNGLFQKR